MGDTTFEKENAEVVALLRAASPLSPPPSFTSKVMERVELDAFSDPLTQDLAQAKPELAAATNFTDEVLSRISAAPQHQTDAPTPRIFRWLSYAGTAVAAGLAVALFYAPLSGWLGEDESPTQGAATTAEQPNPQENEAASDNLPGQIRFARNYEGRKLWVVDLGLVEGARVGDLMEWRDETGKGGNLRVVGVSSYYSICNAESVSQSQPQERSGVRFATLSDSARRQRSAIVDNTTPSGAFFGLGVIFAEKEEGLVVREVISKLWRPEWSRPRPSRASSLGLQRGDKLLSLMNEKVVNDADLERVLARVPQEGVRLNATVSRHGHAHPLNER